MTIRVLVADDQAVVRAGLAALLDQHDDLSVVGQAGDGAEAVRVATEQRPDVMLLDVRMPVLDGLQAPRALLGAPPAGYRPRVLMLTTFDLDDYVYEALRAGAGGFLLKDTPPDELAAAVRVVAAGETLLAPSVTRRLIEDFTRVRPPAAANRAATVLRSLTPRETEVLVLVARGLSNTEIADTLIIADDTVKTHLGHVFDKLAIRDRTQAVVLAYETGLVTPGAPDANQ